MSINIGEALAIIERLKSNSINAKLFPVVGGGCNVIIECENMHHVITGSISDVQINALYSFLINNEVK